MLYSFPMMIDMDFHKLVDNKDDFVIIFRLSNGYTIGFYSQLGLRLNLAVN